MEFEVLQKAVMKNFEKFKSLKHLYQMDVDKDEIYYDHYLGAFEEGTNPIFRERTEHDCSCCKSFIRNIGGVCGIIDGKLVSIWDFEVGGIYQPVVDSLSAYVKSKAIKHVYFSESVEVGTKSNVEE